MQARCCLLSITTLYVTHDQLEALTMSDVVAVMNCGEIVQESSPMQIYQAPTDRFVANPISLANFIEGRVAAIHDNSTQTGAVETAGGVLRCVLPAGTAAGQPVVLLARPEDVVVCRPRGTSPEENCMEGRVETVMFTGESLDCQVSVGSQHIRFRQHPSSRIARGDCVLLHLPAESCRAIASD